MTPIRFVMFVSLLAVAGVARAQESRRIDSTHIIKHTEEENFLVPADADVTQSILGRGFSSSMRDVDAEGKKIIPVYTGKKTTIPTDRFASLWTDIDDATKFALSAGYFGLGVSERTDASSRYALLTVYQVDKIVKIDTSAERPETEAELVPTEIWYGWCLTYLFTAHSSGGSLAANLKVMNFGVDGKTELAKKNVSSIFQATGLERKVDSEIPVVMSLGDVMKYFKPSKHAQPVLVKYEVVRPFSSSLLPGRRTETVTRADAWVSQAENVLKSYLRDHGTGIAANIQRIAHPTATSPSFGNAKFEHTSNGIAVTVVSDWRGGFFGGAHSTRVRWEIGPRGSIGISVYDDGNISISKKAMGALHRYFEQQIYNEVSGDLTPP